MDRAALRSALRRLRHAPFGAPQRDRADERAVREAEATRHVIPAVPDGVCLLSVDGTALDRLDDGHRTIVESYSGRRPVEQILPPDVASRLLALFAASDRRVGPIVEVYTVLIDGVAAHFEAQMASTGDGHVLTLVRDVTDQVRMTAALRESHQRNADLAGRLIEAQEAERTRIARDLHDDLGQQLAALTIRLGLLRQRLAAGAVADLEREMARVEREVRSMAEYVRELSHDLHPAILRHAGLTAAVRAFCEDLARRHRLTVRVGIGSPPGPLPPDVELCLYRVVQESLHNVIRHSGASAASVDLSQGPGGIELCIADGGTGFDAQQPQRGLGLVSIAERVRLCGGHLQLDTSPGHGTRVVVRLPLRLPAVDASSSA